MQRNFRTKLWLAFGIFSLVAALFSGYVIAEKRIDHANERARALISLGNELRLSSDDLTHMARTYAATGEPIYRAHYDEILGIRSGTRPRPQHYERIYWDFVMADDRRPTPMGAAASITELMQRAGITDQEYQLLSLALAQSNELVPLERQAMALVQEHPGDADARTAAVGMLNDERYHQAKAAIMRPINDFLQAVDRNNTATVDQTVRDALVLRCLVIAACCLQLYALWLIYRDVDQTLGTSVDQLHDFIDSLHHSEDPPAPVPLPRRGSSVYDWLQQLRQRLRDEDRRRAAAEASLAKRTAELETLNNELNELSRKDPLTGLYNRRAADECLSAELARLKRSSNPREATSLLFLDIDHFKHVNDQHGHEVGDAVLKRLSAVLRSCLRDTDFAARYGGEEFLVVLIETPLLGAQVVAEKIRTHVASLRDPVLPLTTVSIGIAAMSHADANGAAALQRADVALYRAKNTGRNRTVYSDAG